MSIRRISSSIGVAVGIVSVTLALAGPAAATPQFWSSPLRCGGGRVATDLPGVAANQGVIGNSSWDVVLVAKLYRLNGSTWQHVQTSRYFGAEVYSNTGPTLGTDRGYAGPEWYPYEGSQYSQAATSIYFNVASGSYYAVQIWVWDGTWAYQWSTNGSLLYCRA